MRCSDRVTSQDVVFPVSKGCSNRVASKYCGFSFVSLVMCGHCFIAVLGWVIIFVFGCVLVVWF